MLQNHLSQSTFHKSFQFFRAANTLLRSSINFHFDREFNNFLKCRCQFISDGFINSQPCVVTGTTWISTTLESLFLQIRNIFILQVQELFYCLSIPSYLWSYRIIACNVKGTHTTITNIYASSLRGANATPILLCFSCTPNFNESGTCSPRW